MLVDNCSEEFQARIQEHAEMLRGHRAKRPKEPNCDPKIYPAAWSAWRNEWKRWNLELERLEMKTPRLDGLSIKVDLTRAFRDMQVPSGWCP